MNKAEAIKFLTQVKEAIEVVLAQDEIRYQVRLTGVQPDKQAYIIRVLRNVAHIDMSLIQLMETFVKPARNGELPIVKVNLTKEEANELSQKLFDAGGVALVEMM